MPARTLQPARRTKLWRDKSGSALLEFGLLAPILIALLLSICDIAPSTMVRFKTGNATQSVADLTSQFSVLQTSDVPNLYAAGADVMAPFAGTPLVLRITNIASDGNGNAFVYWSCGQGALTPYVAKSAFSGLPGGPPLSQLIWLYNITYNGFPANGTNTTFVMVESNYLYTAPARFVLNSPQPITTVAYTLPRLSSTVGFPWDGNPNDVPTLPTSTTKTASVTLGNVVCNYAY